MNNYLNRVRISLNATFPVTFNITFLTDMYVIKEMVMFFEFTFDVSFMIEFKKNLI